MRSRPTAQTRFCFEGVGRLGPGAEGKKEQIGSKTVVNLGIDLAFTLDYSTNPNFIKKYHGNVQEQFFHVIRL